MRLQRDAVGPGCGADKAKVVCANVEVSIWVLVGGAGIDRV